MECCGIREWDGIFFVQMWGVEGWCVVVNRMFYVNRLLLYTYKTPFCGGDVILHGIFMMSFIKWAFIASIPRSKSYRASISKHFVNTLSTSRIVQ